MILKILVGGLALAIGSGAYVGWRLARGESVLPPAFGSELLDSQRIEARSGSRGEPAGRTPELESPKRAGLRSVVPADEPARAGSARPPASASATSQRVEEVASWRELARSGVPASDEQLAACVEALRDDTLRWNATAALELLQANGPRALRRLEQALSSKDEQQRILAACAYVRIDGHAPTPQLARILESLLTPAPGGSYGEITPRPWIARVGRANLDERGCAFWALCEDPRLFQHVELELEQRLQGPECAARFDAAFVIVQHAGARARAQAFRVLVDHLCDNRLSDDAALAMRELARAGDEGLAAVRAALPGRDEQQSRLLRHFLARFEPGHAAAQALEPKQLSAMGFDCGDMLAEQRARR